MCTTISWELLGTEFLMLEPILLHGFRATHLPGEPRGHRLVSSIDGDEYVSHGITTKHISKYSCRRERKTRLADLCGLYSDTNPYRQGAVQGR